MDSRIFREWLQRSKPIGFIGKLLKLRCLKWAHMTLKHKLWPKEELGVKLPIWFATIKSWKLPWFPCVQVACHIPLESSWQGLQLCFKFYYNQGLHTKLWDSKVAKVRILGISRLPLESPRTKWHLGVSFVAKHKEYYKGEGGGFPQVGALVSLVSLCLLMARPCTKNASIMH
jgi:hypothetical protein